MRFSHLARKMVSKRISRLAFTEWRSMLLAHGQSPAIRSISDVKHVVAVHGGERKPHHLEVPIRHQSFSGALLYGIVDPIGEA